MRLLLINPNISESVSQLILAEAQRSAPDGATLEILTAPFGVAYIETRFEALIGAYASAQLAAEHHQRFDAVVVAAFGDPGLTALREVLPIPVTGLTEAALIRATELGRRFSVIAISQRIEPWYREVIQACGHADRLASIRSLSQPLQRIDAIAQDHAGALKALAERAVHEDGADVIVLAGAPLAGLARSLQGQLPVPVVDGVASAVLHAAKLVAQKGAGDPKDVARAPSKPNQGLTPAMARLLAPRAAESTPDVAAGEAPP